MKKYIVKNKADGSVIGTFDSKEESFKCMVKAAEEGISELVFDVKEIEDYPSSFEDACKVLGISDYITFKGSDEPLVKSAMAFYKLCVIAKAWNKIDGFVPDFSNSKQSKYYPWFFYESTHAGFVYANTYNTAAYTGANFGSRLCFKSFATARKFGETFTELYNEIFI